MKELELEDYKFLYVLDSVNNALTLSVTNPVFLTEYTPLVDHMAELDIFYDCWGNENEARSFMRRRLETASEDIESHLESHRRMLEYFYQINESMSRNSRIGIVNGTMKLSEELVTYGNIVASHLKSLGEIAFLRYPKAQNIMFADAILKYEDWGGRIYDLSFNSLGTMEGLERGVRILKSLASRYKDGKTPVQMIQFGDHDSGSGIMDTSFRGRLELAEELIRRAKEF